MKISHDTLLLYAYKIICKYDELKRFIIDKYPYFFVDEYQDTSEIVVSILTEIVNYSNKINHPVFVGYFEDSVQNIYDAGIGIKIEEYCKEYEHIKKQYNRRSCSEIILLSNKIRHDDIEQKSVYKDSTGGSVKIYYGSEDDIEDFICVNSVEMKENSIEDKSVHCFLLVNKIVAEHAGLAELYDWFNISAFSLQTCFKHSTRAYVFPAPAPALNNKLLLQSMHDNNSFITRASSSRAFSSNILNIIFPP